MNSNLKIMVLSLAVSLGVLPIGTASAVEQSVDEPLELLVLTPTRTKTSLSDAPAAVSVVTASDIKEMNVSRLGDALEQVPSLFVRGGALGQSQGTIGTSGMSLRGVDQNKTLILIDGQPIQDASSGKVNWRIPFVEDIARIEIVPGAYSSLYGSNAIGGVINIITKDPEHREFVTKVGHGWDDASGTDASVYFRDKLKNGLGVVAGIGHQDRDSYVNDFVVKAPSACPPPPASCGTPVIGAQRTTTRDGTPVYLVGDLGRVPWTATNATIKLSYDINGSDKLYGGIAHEVTDQHYSAFNTYLRDASTGAPLASGTLELDGQQIVLTDYNFTLWSSVPLHEAATRSFAGYDAIFGNNNSLKIELAKITRAYSFTLADPTANWNGGSGKLSDTPNSGLDSSCQLTIPIGIRQTLVTGLALHKDSVNQLIYTLSNWRDPDTKNSVNSGFNGYSTTTSVYVQDQIDATDDFTIYLGERWDNWETKGDNFAVSPASSTSHPSRSATALSPKISIVYKANDSTTLRSSYGKSFRAPANQDLYTSSTSRGRTTSGDPNLHPERGTSWELGGEYKLAESTKFSATYYETELDNLIYLQQVSSTASLRINAGLARISGTELSVIHKLASWLDIEANYAYINSRMISNPTDPLSVGKRLTDSPKNIAGIGLTGKHGAWSGSITARYNSHIFWTAQNTDTVEGVPGSYDAYTMVNAKLGYEFSKGISGSVAINNLLDTRAYSYFLLPRRNVTAEAAFTF
jgi:iron complex outermembrane receptor protein